MLGAALGSGAAQERLAIVYSEEGWIVKRDKEKALHYNRLAAMRGHVIARHNLGIAEKDKGSTKVYVSNAVKHWKIAAMAGSDYSMDFIEDLLSGGYPRMGVTVEIYEDTLAAYLESQNESKSDQREEDEKRRTGRESSISLTVPPNVRPGEEIQVYAGYKIVKVRCPKNVCPGQSIQISVPVDPMDRANSDGGNFPTCPCSVCGKKVPKTTLLRCIRCKADKYFVCSRDCRRNDWPNARIASWCELKMVCPRKLVSAPGAKKAQTSMVSGTTMCRTFSLHVTCGGGDRMCTKPLLTTSSPTHRRRTQ